jgi:hypothetical protein
VEHGAQAVAAESRALDIDVADVLIEGYFRNLQYSAFADLTRLNWQ